MRCIPKRHSRAKLNGHNRKVGGALPSGVARLSWPTAGATVQRTAQQFSSGIPRLPTPLPAKLVAMRAVDRPPLPDKATTAANISRISAPKTDWKAYYGLPRSTAYRETVWFDPENSPVLGFRSQPDLAKLG